MIACISLYLAAGTAISTCPASPSRARTHSSFSRPSFEAMREREKGGFSLSRKPHTGRRRSSPVVVGLLLRDSHLSATIITIIIIIIKPEARLNLSAFIHSFLRSLSEFVRSFVHSSVCLSIGLVAAGEQIIYTNVVLVARRKNQHTPER